jgi:hypothetical protein
MKKIEFRLHHSISDEIIEKRFNCFNEILHYYKTSKVQEKLMTKIVHILGFILMRNLLDIQG